MSDLVSAGIRRNMNLYKIFFPLLILLALGGVGYTDINPAGSHFYWLCMVPVFAASCLVLEWTEKRDTGLPLVDVLRGQLMLWLSLLVGVMLVYMLLHAGRLESESAGLIMLLLLTMTTFAAGVQLGVLVTLLGCFLALSLVLAAYIESYVWLIMLALLVGAGLMLHFYGRFSANH